MLTSRSVTVEDSASKSVSLYVLAPFVSMSALTVREASWIAQYPIN